MGFHSKARVTKSRSIARVVAPPAPQIFSPSAAATLTLTGQTPPDFLAAWRPSSSATLTLTGQTPIWGGVPQQISGLVAWFAADFVSGLSDGTAVTTWNDLSGLGHDITQANSLKRPIYKVGIVNGLPVVRFDGSNDFLQASTFTLAQPYTIFVVVAGTDMTFGPNQAVADGNSAGTGEVYFEVIPPNGNMNVYAGSILVSTKFATAGEFSVFEAIFNGGSSIANKNGAGASGNAGAANPSGLTLGSAADGTSPLKGDIAEVLVYNSGLSSGNRSTLRSYLGSKYNITVV